MPESLDQVRAALEDELADRKERGVCGCGCEQRVTAGGNGRRVYLDRHRDRAYRARLRRLAEAQGIATRLNMDAVTPKPKAPAKPRAPRPGLSVYFPSPEHARAALAALEGPPAQTVAEQHLRYEARGALSHAIDRRAERDRRAG